MNHLMTSKQVRTMKAIKLSQAQYKMLSNVATGAAWDAHLVSKVAQGGARTTRAILLRTGCMKNGVVTDVGRRALLAYACEHSTVEAGHSSEKDESPIVTPYSSQPVVQY